MVAMAVARGDLESIPCASYEEKEFWRGGRVRHGWAFCLESDPRVCRKRRQQGQCIRTDKEWNCLNAIWQREN